MALGGKEGLYWNLRLIFSRWIIDICVSSADTNQKERAALKKVNEELILMYWNVGEFLSKEPEKMSFGDSYIDSVVEDIQRTFPGIKGFKVFGNEPGSTVSLH